MSADVFPHVIRTMLVELSADHESEEISGINCEEHLWGDTSMGFGGIAGQAMTPGWIVTISYYRKVDVWHVSRYGSARLRKSTPIQSIGRKA